MTKALYMAHLSKLKKSVGLYEKRLKQTKQDVNNRYIIYMYKKRKWRDTSKIAEASQVLFPQ